MSTRRKADEIEVTPATVAAAMALGFMAGLLTGYLVMLAAVWL